MSEQTKTARPAVTVLMPVYNGERYVGAAVESVLRQTWDDFEFVVIDDGSEDRTREVVGSFDDARIRFVKNDVNVGLTKSLNRGLALSRGEFVARQDADDLSHPARLAEQVAFLREHTDVALVGTQARVVDERGRVLRRPGWRRATGDAAIRFQLMFDNAFIHSSVIFRRAVVRDEFGGYDEGFGTGQDFELWSRVAARHEVRNLARRLVDHRLHARSAGARYGEEHVGLSGAVVAANLRRELKLERVPEEWPRLISRMHVNRATVVESDLVELADVAVEIYERFVETHPEAQSEREIRGVLAAKLCQVACGLAPVRRGAALGVYRRAALKSALTTGTFAVKFVSLLLLGERVRGLEGLVARGGAL